MPRTITARWTVTEAHEAAITVPDDFDPDTADWSPLLAEHESGESYVYTPDRHLSEWEDSHPAPDPSA